MLARHGTHGGRLGHLAVANTGSACVSNGRRRTAPAVRARAVPSAARAAARQPASRKQVSQLGARRACRPQRKTTCHTPADSDRTAQIDATHSAAAVRAGELGRICASRGAAARAPAGGWSSASALGRDGAACGRRCGTRARGPTRATTMPRSRRSARRTRAAAPRARGKGCTVCREAPAPQLAAAGPAVSRPGISRLPHHGWDPGSRGGQAGTARLGQHSSCSTSFQARSPAPERSAASTWPCARPRSRQPPGLDMWPHETYWSAPAGCRRPGAACTSQSREDSAQKSAGYCLLAGVHGF